MPSARHDLRRADQGQDSARHLGRRERPSLDQERQGAGSLLRRDSADDRQRHLHGQRDRARHRVAAPSLARSVLRARQGPHPFDRQAVVLGAHHSLSRKLDRFRIRPARRALCAHRSAPQVSRDRAAARAGHDHRGPAQLLLQEGRYQSSTPSSTPSSSKPDQSARDRGSAATSRIPSRGEVLAREGRKFNKAIVRQMEQAKITRCRSRSTRSCGRISAHDVVDSNTGEVAGAHQRGADRGKRREAQGPTGSRRSKCCSPRISPAAARCA